MINNNRLLAQGFDISVFDSLKCILNINKNNSIKLTFIKIASNFLRL